MANTADEYRQFLSAASFAARAHHGQMRKDRATPYVSHVFRVCLVVRDVFGFRRFPHVDRCASPRYHRRHDDGL